ncbi:aminotransferase class V-fold PLP-dependent enzyme [Clostridium sediminicola]
MCGSNYDLGIVLDKFNIAIRFGNHCAQPLMNALKTDGTLRNSFEIL